MLQISLSSNGSSAKIDQFLKICFNVSYVFMTLLPNQYKILKYIPQFLADPQHKNAGMLF